MLTMAWKHLSLGPIVLIACIVLCGEAMAFQNVMSPFARSRIYSCDSAPASTRRTQRARDGALHLAATGRREVLLASVASGLLLVQPAGATDFRKAVEIFGSDGDLPPGFAEQLAAKIGKTMDKNFIDKRRPAPVRLPRTEVYKPFAVLLMRSCYDAVDALNFVPMDKFQKDFFLLRQNEWEKYLAENDCKQGDLSNPQYFDFISAAQFATISQQMVDAQKIFEERTGAEGTMTVVSRDADLQDNEQLPSAFFKVAGDKMYDGLMANFTGELFFTQPPIPVAPDASDDQVVAALTQLYKKMVELGYALEVKVSADDVVPPQALLQEAAMVKTFASAFAASGAVPASAGSLSQAKGRRVCFTLKAPATLWGRQWLGMQEYLHTDHDVMLAMAFLRKCGRTASVHTKVDANSMTREYVLL